MNPLVQAVSQKGNMGNLGNLLNMMKSGNPEQFAKQLMQQNPNFKAFMESVQGKTPEQYCKENGIDFEQIKGMLK